MSNSFRPHDPGSSSNVTGHMFSSVGSNRAKSEHNTKPEPLTTSRLGNVGSQPGQHNIRTISSQLPLRTCSDHSAVQALREKLTNATPSTQPEPGVLERSPGSVMPHQSSSNSTLPTLANGNVTRGASADSAVGDSDARKISSLERQLAEAQRTIATMNMQMSHNQQQQRNRGQPEGTGPSDTRGSENARAGPPSVIAAQRPWAEANGGNSVNSRSPFSVDGLRSEPGPTIANSGSFNPSASIWGTQVNSLGLIVPTDNPRGSTPANNDAWAGATIRPPVTTQTSSSNPPVSQPTRPEFLMHTVNVPSQMQVPVPQRVGPGLSSPSFLNDLHENYTNEAGARSIGPVPRSSPVTTDPRSNRWSNVPNGMNAFDARHMSSSATSQSVALAPPSNGISNLSMNQEPGQSRAATSRLSPMAREFNVESIGNPWNTRAPDEVSTVTYIAPVEPLNYRRLLDRNASCDWSYIVDKIVCGNDQQASIFLQQKLKNATPEHKFEIVQAIINQAYPLMVNRFGNFLVQRCFEHGTPEQVITIAEAIRGKTRQLSMDPFGCHVIQKAFDSVPEKLKAMMIRELLRDIPETVVHRYACHVWQKLFELRWNDSPPQIMKYVNEALRGMWHEVALGETGSLVVQNIFENCLEEDKRPCIMEVLNHIDEIAHGQFGNWCIQHICEHGTPADKARALEHIIQHATEYSMDQYASKVIEKCLKIGGDDFLSKYLGRVCEGHQTRPRMPLIDIAGDQFGNYLVQWILSNASASHRELVATHVRKHMVSLRGSKYGSRVAMLCNNPHSATRPGPPAGMGVGRYNHHSHGPNGGMGSMGSRHPYNNYR